MMDTDLLMMAHDTAGHSKFIPKLDTLEGQHTHLNRDHNVTKEE